MKTPILPLTLLALIPLSSQSAIVVDGTRDAGSTVRSVQTIASGFGDNFSEWNAAYGDISGGRLELMFTGNLEANFNKLEIFIDSSASGNTNVLNTAGNDGSGVMNGMTFDSGFTPDYHIIARRGFDGTPKFDLDFSQLGTTNFSSYTDVFGGADFGSGTTGTGLNTSPIDVAYDGSNVAGIGGSAGAAADQSAALAVTTGLELSIDLADLGSPTGPVRVMLLQNNSGHDFLSNQTLGGLPVGTGNLGADPNLLDFNDFAGNQFFLVPEPSTSLLGLLGFLALLRRRR